VKTSLTSTGWLRWAAALTWLIVAGCGDGDPAPAVPADGGVDGDLPDRGAADCGAEAGSEPAVPGTPVTGTWIYQRLGSQGKVNDPNDLSTLKIGAWAGADFARYVAGAGTADGAFTVPNVPPGPFLLVLEYANGYRTMVASDGDLRSFDFGSDRVANVAGAAPAAPDKTVLELALAGLAPWNASDRIDILTTIPFSWGFLGSPFTPGETTAALRLDLSNRPKLDGPGRGDEVYIVQSGETILPGDIHVVMARAAVTTRALHTVDGQTVMASETLKTLPADGTIDLDVRRSQFLPFAPAGGDPTLSIIVSRSPPDVADLGTYDTATITVPAGSGDLHLDAREANPFPTSWPRVADVGVSFPTTMYLPGGMRPLLASATMRVIDRADVLQAAPVVPRLGPARAPQIAGRPAELPQVGVGLTPSISWTAPALGQTTLYELSLRRIDVQVDRVTEVTVAAISTTATRVHLPPGVLEAGQWYRFRVRAIAAQGVGPATPYRSSLPWVEASLLSGRFTP
jgi:hypothetical protein